MAVESSSFNDVLNATEMRLNKLFKAQESTSQLCWTPESMAKLSENRAKHEGEQQYFPNCQISSGADSAQNGTTPTAGDSSQSGTGADTPVTSKKGNSADKQKFDVFRATPQADAQGSDVSTTGDNREGQTARTRLRCIDYKHRRKDISTFGLRQLDYDDWLDNIDGQFHNNSSGGRRNLCHQIRSRRAGTVNQSAPGYYVSADAARGGNGTKDHPFNSLQAAQTAMQDSDIKTTYVMGNVQHEQCSQSGEQRQW